MVALRIFYKFFAKAGVCGIFGHIFVLLFPHRVEFVNFFYVAFCCIHPKFHIFFDYSIFDVVVIVRMISDKGL